MCGGNIIDKQWGLSVVDLEILHHIDELQLRYIRALDERDMDAWTACFTADSQGYRCISRENHEQELPVAMMLDDNPARIQDRAKFVQDVWKGTFEDYATRHFVQRLFCRNLGDGGFEVHSNVLVTYTTASGGSDVLVAGSYRDEVVAHDGVYGFRRKDAILDTDVPARYLVYPI